MPLTAVRHIRKMRGGAQSHLLEADDGHWYVVKFRNNPQHRRILVNELLASVFLRLSQNLRPADRAAARQRRLPARQPRGPPDARHTAHRCRTRLALRLPLPRRPGPHRGLRLPARCPSVRRSPTWTTSAASWSSTSGRATPTAGSAIFYRADVRRIAPRRLAARLRGAHDRPRLRLQRPTLGLPGFAAARPLRPQLVYDAVRSLDDFQPWLDTAPLPRRGHGPGLETDSAANGSTAKRTRSNSCWNGSSNGALSSVGSSKRAARRA